MRITFVLPKYKRQPIGGYRVIYEYANRLTARGHQLTVLHATEITTEGCRWWKRAEIAIRPARMHAIGEEVEDDALGCGVVGPADQPAGDRLVHRVQRAGEADEIGLRLGHRLRLGEHIARLERTSLQSPRRRGFDHLIQRIEAHESLELDASLKQVGGEIALAAARIEDHALGEAGQLDHDVETEQLRVPAAPQHRLERRPESPQRLAIGLEKLFR